MKGVKERYAAWLESINSIDRRCVGSTQTISNAMTEEEWLNACRYFDGCAICGEIIDAKMYFVPLKDGGKYTSYNMIPVCEACALKRRGDTYQPFKYFNKAFGTIPNGEARLERMIGYLSKEIEKHEERLMHKND